MANCRKINNLHCTVPLAPTFNILGCTFDLNFEWNQLQLQWSLSNEPLRLYNEVLGDPNDILRPITYRGSTGYEIQRPYLFLETRVIFNWPARDLIVRTAGVMRAGTSL